MNARQVGTGAVAFMATDRPIPGTEQAVCVQVLFDGDRFSTDSGDYGLRETLEAIHGLSTPGVRVEVFASRWQSFAFAALAQTDVLLLFGDQEGASVQWPEEQSAALLGFMNRGGGVFATGDHYNHGNVLCALLPRIQHLRDWGGGNSPKGGPGSVCTLAPAQTSDDLDSSFKPVFPEQVKPHYHELLQCSTGGAIRWLPDHIHEGNLDTRAAEAAAGADLGAGEPMQIDYLAWTLAWSLTPEWSGNPRQVPVIKCCAPVDANSGVGRIVVDSTFHHWVSQNVRPILQPGQEERLQHWLSYVANVVAYLLPRQRLEDLATPLLDDLRCRPVIANALPLEPFMLVSVLERVLPELPLTQRVLRRVLGQPDATKLPATIAARLQAKEPATRW